jgi:hypothetical protein
MIIPLSAWLLLLLWVHVDAIKTFNRPSQKKNRALMVPKAKKHTKAGSGADSQVTPTPSPPIPQGDTNLETQGSVEEATGLVTSCKEVPSNGEPSADITTVKYEYVTIVTKGSNIGNILASVEEETHKAFTSELLVCDATRRRLQNYGYTTVYSIPLDEVNTDKACENTPENQDCYIINGGAKFEHLPGVPDNALSYQIGGILADSYDGGALNAVNPNLLGLHFVSITEEITAGVDTLGDNNPAGDDPAAAEVGDGAETSASQGKIGGAVAITIAAVGLVVVGLLVFRRRQSNHRSINMDYLDDKDDKDTLLDDGELSTGSSSSAALKTTVLDDELDDETSYMHLERSYDLAQFDQNMTHVPKSSNRSMELQPVFVDTDRDLTVSNREELGPELLSNTSSERAYFVPDTVEL